MVQASRLRFLIAKLIAGRRDACTTIRTEVWLPPGLARVSHRVPSRDAVNGGLARRVSSATLDATEEGAANFFALDHSQHVEDRRVKRNAVQGVILGVVSGNYGEKSGLGVEPRDGQADGSRRAHTG